MTNLNYKIEPCGHGDDQFAEVIKVVDAYNASVTAETPKALSRNMGQVFTHSAMANQLAQLSKKKTTHAIIGDPGAGNGQLSINLAAKLTHCAQDIDIFGFETDQRLHQNWDDVWALFKSHSKKNRNIQSRMFDDFCNHAAVLMETGARPECPKPSHITMNPPYNKLSKSTDLARTFLNYGLKITNYYTAFIALAVRWLQDDGELTAILPRSFTSGETFHPFREWLLKQVTVDHIILYKSRSCFTNILQENLIIKLTKRDPLKHAKSVRITLTDTPTSKPDYDLILPYNDAIKTSGFCLPRRAEDIKLINENNARAQTLNQAGFHLSTGKVELHRLKNGNETTILYARDFSNGEITWAENRKPRTVCAAANQVLDLPENGDGYVGLKRISSPESNTRLFPVFINRETTGLTKICLENHVQFFHDGQLKPINKQSAMALIKLLNSSTANAVICAHNGTTQINNSDIARLKM
ncbi:Eco57I restriction-modification methylase domain-containing protein [Photobacterium leiognathi]|uniref:Eco57I restriction-modification methylase domain-containing protein n=1 Tax=Photobacterium leiognathi TaxID=553611 RepID=UPI002981766F|nr:Eco57I restriction-modification methylase domain-containing protein [Photobacterium leiognathi]